MFLIDISLMEFLCVKIVNLFSSPLLACAFLAQCRTIHTSAEPQRKCQHCTTLRRNLKPTHRPCARLKPDRVDYCACKTRSFFVSLLKYKTNIFIRGHQSRLAE
jgi:hypothetical protein